jgi:hypothetical protein
MPTVITEGAMAARGFVFGASAAAANYIEDVFSTYLYTGNGSAQTITNGIDLSTKGGLVWLKDRTSAYSNILTDTARGATKVISSDGTYAQSTYPTMLTAFNSNGFSLGSSTTTNQSGDNYASWSFREQPKFFDIVTYTGTGSNTTIAHNLGSTPGCIIVKRLDITSDCQVYHSGLTSAAYSIQLNSTAAQASATTVWNSTAPTSSVFSVGTSTAVNASGGTYVAYLFASNAGGFGAAGTDNVITCGSYTTDGSGNATVTLGYEPQWVLTKASSDGSSSWFLQDNMRGLNNSNTVRLYPNLINAEFTNSGNYFAPTATGFQDKNLNGPSTTVIYIAIRRGPMKTPTDATKVFTPIARTGTGAVAQVTGVGFPPDLLICEGRQGYNGTYFVDRLRGISPYLNATTTNQEISSTNSVTSFNMDGVSLGADTPYGFVNYTNYPNRINWFFQRAPGFFDEVCYTGTGANTTFNHNLGVVPEMMIVKRRSGAAANWIVYEKDLASGDALILQTTSASSSFTLAFNSTAPTSSVFTVGTLGSTNSIGDTFVNYLFATCPGVSKVGSYTGTGATQTINCGFTGGARFVLIKRTDSTGDWYVWDTARGMVSGTDPSLLMNTDAAEVNANSVYTATTGFQIVSTAAGINASGGSYIFLAIA